MDLANIWQKNYYEHVIRGRSEYERIAAYIAANPEHWAEDAEADRTFNMLMGDAVDPRKRFVQTHARAVRNLDI